MRRLALIVLVACSTPSPPADERAALGGEIAARVGQTAIPVSLVAKVAEVQKIPPRDALRLLVDDAVAAEAARVRGLDTKLPESWRLTAAEADVARLTAALEALPA